MKNNKAISIIALTPVTGLLALAGCGSSHSAPHVAASPHAASAASHTAPSPTSSGSSAAANERQFAEDMSQAITDVPAQLVSGPVMRSYIKYQHANDSAWGAAGQPGSSESVTPITGGYKLCWPDTGNGSGCESFTQFTVNAAGQVTGFSVNGQPVAGRVASAPSATSDGLTVSDVTAYELTTQQNVVEVTFKLTDRSYKPVNTSPSLLASLNGASDDTNDDALPADLRPRDTLYATAGFDVAKARGLFCLEPNDGFSEQLPCTTLHKA